MSMRCFAVKQPWASLIIYGGKDVENRSKPWPSTIKLPATVLIMASKKLADEASIDRAAILRHGNTGRAGLKGLPLGAILGTVRVTGCTQQSKSKWAEPDAFHYLLTNPKPFDKPIPFPAGRMGVFKAPDVAALHAPHDGTTRRVDCREELPDVMITRNAGPWGNPYKITKGSSGAWAVEMDGQPVAFTTTNGQKDALAWGLHKYRRHIEQNDALLARLHELKGKRLGCFCKASDPCHGDVLVKLVKELCA